MNFELAKQLKDAGFPDKYTKDCKCLPTLSLLQLIDACGDKFYGLINYKELGYVADYWHEKGETDRERQYFKTPEDAVADLWLYLNNNPKVETN